MWTPPTLPTPDPPTGALIKTKLSVPSFPSSLYTSAALSALAVISLLVRLQANRYLLVPSYFDSAEHLRLIQALISGAPIADVLRTTTIGYYHIGFHLIVAAIARTFAADPVQLVLAAGPLMLALLPVPVYGLLRHLGYSRRAAFFGGLIAAWGWGMPAYALNWGKYPLLAGLLFLPLGLSAGHLVAQSSSKQRILRPGLFIATILFAATFHIRTLALIGLAAAAWMLTARLETFPTRKRITAGILALAVIVLLGAGVESQPLLRSTFDPYLGQRGLTTLIVLLALPFALKSHPRITLSWLLLLAGMLAGLFLPAGWVIPGQTVLDRPFVETALYLPLAGLGALGLDGLFRTLRPKISALLASLCFLAVAVNAMWMYDPRPACCVLYTAPDAIVLDWIDTRLPATTRILTAVSEMRVLAEVDTPALAGSDAGVWIPVLIGRETIPLPFNANFSDPATLRAVCQTGADHIYIGSSGARFNRADIEARPDWYAPVFSMPPSYIFRVTGCQ